MFYKYPNMAHKQREIELSPTARMRVSLLGRGSVSVGSGEQPDPPTAPLHHHPWPEPRLVPARRTLLQLLCCKRRRVEYLMPEPAWHAAGHALGKLGPWPGGDADYTAVTGTGGVDLAYGRVAGQSQHAHDDQPDGLSAPNDLPPSLAYRVVWVDRLAQPAAAVRGLVLLALIASLLLPWWAFEDDPSTGGQGAQWIGGGMWLWESRYCIQRLAGRSESVPGGFCYTMLAPQLPVAVDYFRVAGAVAGLLLLTSLLALLLLDREPLLPLGETARAVRAAIWAEVAAEGHVHGDGPVGVTVAVDASGAGKGTASGTTSGHSNAEGPVPADGKQNSPISSYEATSHAFTAVTGLPASRLCCLPWYSYEAALLWAAWACSTAAVFGYWTIGIRDGVSSSPDSILAITGSAPTWQGLGPGYWAALGAACALLPLALWQSVVAGWARTAVHA